MKIVFFITLGFAFAIVFAALPYRAYTWGKEDGCYDLVKRLNDYGYNHAKEGIGLSDYYWCHHPSLNKGD
jgi:hypothetical protein